MVIWWRGLVAGLLPTDITWCLRCPVWQGICLHWYLIKLLCFPFILLFFFIIKSSFLQLHYYLFKYENNTLFTSLTPKCLHPHNLLFHQIVKQYEIHQPCALCIQRAFLQGSVHLTMVYPFIRQRTILNRKKVLPTILLRENASEMTAW